MRHGIATIALTVRTTFLLTKSYNDLCTSVMSPHSKCKAKTYHVCFIPAKLISYCDGT